MPSFLSICLTLLRIAIATTNAMQGLLIELHNAVEWLRDGPYPSTSPSTEDHSLTEPSISEAVNAEKVDSSKQSIRSSDFTVISHTRNVFVRLDRQSTIRESENSSESLLSSVTKIVHDIEDDRCAETIASRRNQCVPTEDNSSSTFQENELSKSYRNEPGTLITIANKEVSVSEEPTEAVALDTSQNSEVEASINLLPKQVGTTISDRLESSIHSVSRVQDSQTLSPLKESNIDISLEFAPPSGKPVCEPRLVSEESELGVDQNIESYLPLRDYDTSELREKESNIKSSAWDSSIEKSMGKQDPDLRITHSPDKTSLSKNTSGRTTLKTKDNSLIPPAVEQSSALDQSIVSLREESSHPSFRSLLKSQESTQNSSVRFIDRPLLTKNDRIDSMEKIEFVIKPTCGFLSPEPNIHPQAVSRISTPLTIDSDTPDNIRYIEKASRLLSTVSTQCDKEQDYCEINSSATEFPVSGSPTSATASEDAIGSENLPQLLIESPSSTENAESPSKECNSPSSVRLFQLPESHIERESKGIKRESKFRKPPNETSTSEEENETKISRKRRASPGKFYKSPKKFAETTALKIRGYKLSPEKTSNEKKREDVLSCENTSPTRSLDFELGIQQKSDNATTLPASIDQKNLKLETEEQLSHGTIEDQVKEKESSQQITSKSESADDTTSITDNSISETTSSARVVDDVAEDSAPEGTEGLSPETGEPSAHSMVNNDERGSDSAPKGTKELFPSLVNETPSLQEKAVYCDSEADSTFKNDSTNNSLVKDSDKSRETSFSGHVELLDTNKSSQESKSTEDELVSDEDNEKGINEKENARLESTSNIYSLSEDEQKSNCNVQFESTSPSANVDSSKRVTSLESSSSEESIRERSGSESSNEEVAGLASQLQNRTSLSKSSKVDRTGDKNSTDSTSESPIFSQVNKSTNEFGKTSKHEAETDFLSEPKNIAHKINTFDNLVKINTFEIDQVKAAEVESTESMEVSSNTSDSVVSDSQIEDQIPETKQSLQVELSKVNQASFSPNRTTVLSPVYEVSGNGTASSSNYSEYETSDVISLPSASSASEDKSEDLENESSFHESTNLSPINDHGGSDPKKAFSNHSRTSTKGEQIQLNTTSLDLAKQSSIIEKGTGEIKSETETLSSLSSPSKSSNSEVDQKSPITNVSEGISDYHLSSLDTELRKHPTSKSNFSPVLEELVQRIKSASRSNSPTETVSSLEVKDSAEESSDLQLTKTHAKKVYNVKNYFDSVLKELIQRVKLTSVNNSFASSKDENSSMTKIEIPPKISNQTSPAKDFMTVENALILELSNDVIKNVNEAEMKNVGENVRSTNLIACAENIKGNLDFELHIVPQPVPCETAFESNAEVLILNENFADQNEIKIVDSKSPEPELTSPDISTTKSKICQIAANPEDNSYYMCPVVALSNESTNAEILSSTGNHNSSMSITNEVYDGVKSYDFTSNTVVKTAKDNLDENDVQESKKDDPSENTHLETTNNTENTLIEVTKENSTDNSLVENVNDSAESNVVEVFKDDCTENNVETTNCPNKNNLVEIDKDHSTENSLAEVEKGNSTEKTLVKTVKDYIESNVLEVSKDDCTENDNVGATNCSNEKSLVDAEKAYSTENNFVDVMHECSTESNPVDTSTNLDSSVAEEINVDEKEESSKENKPWKKKQRKPKKKRRN